MDTHWSHGGSSCQDVFATTKLFMGLKYTVAGVFNIPVLLNDQLLTSLTAEEVAERFLDVIWTINIYANNPVYIPTMNWKKILRVSEHSRECSS
jgi:hypothetical protein